MVKLYNASARWQHVQGRDVAAAKAVRQVRALAAPMHAAEEGETVALCGARVPITDGLPYAKSNGGCPRCADKAKSYKA